MKKFSTLAGLALALAASVSVAAAQEQQQPAPQDGQRQGAGQEERKPFGRRGGRMHGRMGGGHGLGRKALSRLDLTDAQQTQIRSIHEAARQRTQGQRDELRQLFETRRGGGQLTAEQQARAEQLETELRATHESVNQQVLAVLTAEQRTRLEQWKQERQSRGHGKRHQRQPTENDEQQ